MAGDFNFHVEDDRDSAASRFLDLLEAFNLRQHISEPTHKSGHTLDLIITRAKEDVASNFTVSAVRYLFQRQLSKERSAIASSSPLIWVNCEMT